MCFTPFPGKELFGLDTLHKVLWIKLLEEMFLGMPSEYPWGDEIMLFLNVFNGALLLHPEDSALLRQYSATAINTAVHFNHLFSLSGYQWILPTMLQVISTHHLFSSVNFFLVFMILILFCVSAVLCKRHTQIMRVTHCCVEGLNSAAGSSISSTANLSYCSFSLVWPHC